MGRRITAIKDEYNNNGLGAAVKEVPIQSWDLVRDNKVKTVLTVAALVFVTAYFVSESYRKGAAAVVIGAAHTVAGAHASAVSFLGSKIPFIGTGIFTQILVGVVMVAAAAAITYGLYKGLEKAHSYFGPSGPENSSSTEHNDSNTNDPRTKDDPRTGVSDPSADVGGDKQKTPA